MLNSHFHLIIYTSASVGKCIQTICCCFWESVCLFWNCWDSNIVSGSFIFVLFTTLKCMRWTIKDWFLLRKKKSFNTIYKKYVSIFLMTCCPLSSLISNFTSGFAKLFNSFVRENDCCSIFIDYINDYTRIKI